MQIRWAPSDRSIVRQKFEYFNSDPYEEFTGFVDEFLAEIVADSRDNEDDSANSEGDAHNQDAALI